MKNFGTDLEAAKHYVNMMIIEDVPGSTRKFTLQLEPGNILVGNRGEKSVMGVGEALAQLRNEAGLTPGQVSMSRGKDMVRIEATMDNWNTLRAHVKPVEHQAGRTS